MSGTRRDRPVRATVRNVEESEQIKPTASKVVKSTERRRGKSPGSKSTRTRSVFNFFSRSLFIFVLSTMNDVTRPEIHTMAITNRLAYCMQGKQEVSRFRFQQTAFLLFFFFSQLQKYLLLGKRGWYMVDSFSHVFNFTT